ncbi:hypothetical protein [Rufibacter roseus]|uniref:Glycerophosphoryl diester phosphodiesterase membrane domain-containing protein n=1 Tax=Rufibacter roseus TaxID=1567108 RepID=A0ABW2DL71_9BACT|nr:hypothetical protein [Rufibacter roseus]
MKTKPQPIDFRVERDFGQKINATFGFIRQNFAPLSRCILFIAAPFALLAGIFSGLFQSSQLQALNGEYGAFDSFSMMVGNVHYLATMFFSLMAFVMLSLTVYSYLVLRMDYEGPIEVTDVWEVVKSQAVAVFYSSVAVVIMVALGMLLLIVPGIYLSVVLSIFIIVMVREDLGFIDAVERCFYLMKGNWWPTFGYILVIGLIQALIAFVASLPSMVVYVLRIFHLPGGTNDMVFIAASTFSSIVNLLLYVITTVALAFQYFTLVEIKDGVGLLEKVNQIGQRQPLYPATEQDEI